MFEENEHSENAIPVEGSLTPAVTQQVTSLKYARLRRVDAWLSVLFIRHERKYWLMHLGIALLGAGVPITAFVAVRSYLHRETPFEKVWTAILKRQGLIPIVVADLPERQVPISPYGQSRLPGNVPLVGVAEAIGISELRDALSRSNSAWRPELYLRGEYGRDEKKLNLITVGGPSVNERTRDLSVSYNECKRELIFKEKHFLDGKLVAYYPTHHVVDFNWHPQGKPYANYDPPTDANGITTDYGFIIIGPSPYETGNTVVAFFGVWPQGSQAAIKALVKPENSRWGKKLMDNIVEGKGAVGVVETSVDGLTIEAERLLYVRDLDSSLPDLPTLDALAKAPPPDWCKLTK